MRILNLYAGIGGNRKLWGDDHEITAVEYDKATAEVYQKYFPNDKMIVGDAHDYLLKHVTEFDFIWASPPCPTHSRVRYTATKGKYNPLEIVYPNMMLYQEIILLKHYCQGLYCVENVKPYYEPLISPDVVLHRHFYWCNFRISKFEVSDNRKHDDIKADGDVYGFTVKDSEINDKRKALRNMVDPDLGLHILNCAQGNLEVKTEQTSLF